MARRAPVPRAVTAPGVAIAALLRTLDAGFVPVHEYGISNSSITIRAATRADLAALEELNHISYPELVAENVVWSPARWICPRRARAEVARAIVRGVAAGQEDIAPDPMSRRILEHWARDPKAVERQFGAM